MAQTFKGGIHPNGNKEHTKDKPIERLKAPDFVILPMSMHIGAPCEPIVKKGDYVFLGQKIADSGAPVSSPVHATVSGTIRDILPMPHANGSKVMSIIIDNDFKDELHPDIKPIDITKLTISEMISTIRDAGIVGHGGAAFPTHVKINSSIGKADRLLINASECEPYITSDYRLLLERTEEIVEGTKLLQKIFGNINTEICLESNKRDAVPILKKYLGENSDIKINVLQTKYPQGAEKQLIYAVTKREVPSGKLPADAGCAVFNADTAAAVYRLFSRGIPVIRRIVTVSGNAVVEPKNLEVRIGTPVENLLEACGGLNAPPTKLLMGGPMMGNPLYTTEVPVIKGTNAILAFDEDEPKNPLKPICIRCGRCVDICPMKLVPTNIYKYHDKDSIADLEKLNALDCIECGACSYICPGSLPLVHGIRLAKQRIAASKKK